MLAWKNLEIMVHFQERYRGEDDDESEAKDYESEAENYEFRVTVMYYLHIVKALCNF